LHGYSVALDADIDIFLVDARDFHLQSNVVLVFADVHRRGKASGGQRLVQTFAAERSLEKTVHTVQAILQIGILTDGFPTGTVMKVPPSEGVR
jgi:hypothetical protein